MNGAPGKITSVGQEISFTLKGPASAGQGPFSVRVKRFDTNAHTISVVTLKGHPLAGWRYWRVFPLSNGHIVIETGAVDEPACTEVLSCSGNFWGFLVTKGKQLQTWQDYLESIKRELHATQVTSSSYDNVGGKWDYDKDYILMNVCQATSCY